MKKKKSHAESLVRAERKVRTITQVLSKVSVSNETAEIWDKRRQRLHEAMKILKK